MRLCPMYVAITDAGRVMTVGTHVEKPWAQELEYLAEEIIEEEGPALKNAIFDDAEYSSDENEQILDGTQQESSNSHKLNSSPHRFSITSFENTSEDNTMIDIPITVTSGSRTWTSNITTHKHNAVGGTPRSLNHFSTIGSGSRYAPLRFE